MGTHQEVLLTENLPSNIVESLSSQPSTCKKNIQLYEIISLQQDTSTSTWVIEGEMFSLLNKNQQIWEDYKGV